MRLHHFDGFIGRSGFIGLKAGLFDHIDGPHTDQRFIFYDQHGG